MRDAFHLRMGYRQKLCIEMVNNKVTVQSQAKFQKTGIKCVAFWRLALNSYENFYKREAEERRNDGYGRIKIVMQIIKSNVRRNM